MGVEFVEMTEEDLKEIETKNEMLAKLCGFENGDEMGNFKCEAAEGMIKFGGGFTHHLGHALARADMMNTAKLIRAFQNVCTEHAQLWRKFIAKRDMAEGE